MLAEWERGLQGLTPEQIKRGLDAWSSEWPPSLPEFRATCEGKKLGANEFGLSFVPEVYRQHAPQRDPRRLLSSTERDAKRAEVKPRIAAMRSALAGGSP